MLAAKAPGIGRGTALKGEQLPVCLTKQVTRRSSPEGRRLSHPDERNMSPRKRTTRTTSASPQRGFFQGR